MKTRLECPHSYATDDCPDLLCEFDSKCDGKLYDCCLDYDTGLAMKMILEDRESEEQGMTCDKCKHFKVLYEPLRTEGELWDMGRAICTKHDLVTDFANHGKFKRLDTCENFEPQESEVRNADSD